MSKPLATFGQRAIWRSRSGLIFATLYLIAAAALYFKALTCNDGFFCGIEVLAVFVPAGLIYSELLDQFVGSPIALQWQVIIPTVVTNAVLYYFLGYGVGAALGKLIRLLRVS